MKQKGWYKYIVLFSLYIAQSIPMSFFSTVVPVIMRQNEYSLESIGLLQLVKLPWIFKFLWAPLVDKTAIDMRALKRWIILSEIFYAVIIISTGFLNLETDFKFIIVLMVIAFIASATQDIATDALAILNLKPRERSFGNSVQSAGSFTGTLAGTGILLVIYHFFGWQVLLFMLAAFVILALIPLMFFHKGKVDVSSKKSINFTAIGTFFKVPSAVRRVLFFVVYYSGIIGMLAMLKPFMVDEGYNVKEIGFISGIIGTSVAGISAFISGAIIKKIGRKPAAIIYSLMGIAVAFYFLFLSSTEITLIQTYIGICCLWCTYGLSTVVVYTIAMDNVRKGLEATDFTLQIVLTHLSSLIIAVNSGKIGDAFGYAGLFKFEILLAVTALLVTVFLLPKSNIKNES